VPLSYVLKNGDGVSIMTEAEGGKGSGPATDWMRHARIRSTRSKLRSYFRARQRDGLSRAGEALVADFLSAHSDLIAEKSFLEAEDGWEVPAGVEGLALLLPGKTQFVDIDELLFAVGKSNDRAFLRGAMSKVFLVPLSVLTDADEARGDPICANITAAVEESRRRATDAEVAVKRSQRLKPREIESAMSFNGVSVLTAEQANGEMELADPSHLCEDCLPIWGDDIVGTRPAEDPDAEATVHRRVCHHAQRALNRVDLVRKDGDGRELNGVNGVNGHHIGMKARRPRSRRRGIGGSHVSVPPSRDEFPVALRWPSKGEDDNNQENARPYLVEVIVIAEDRKLLLADCSEIVSQMSDIVRTASATTDEHATFEFLVATKSIDSLQALMNNLSTVDNVMSVERKFGSDLL